MGTLHDLYFPYFLPEARSVGEFNKKCEGTFTEIGMHLITCTSRHISNCITTIMF